MYQLGNTCTCSVYSGVGSIKQTYTAYCMPFWEVWAHAPSSISNFRNPEIVIVFFLCEFIKLLPTVLKELYM